MKDLLNEDYDPKVKQQDSVNSNIETFQMTDEEIETIVDYNKNITNLDPLYANLKLYYDVLVRAYITEPEITDDGIYLPNTEILSVPTKNGMADLYSVANPYPYSTKAVVVSSCDEKYKPGDIVALSHSTVKPIVTGTSENAIVITPKGFVHPDSKLKYAPKDQKNKHYGYLLVAPFDIKIKL